MNLFFFPFWRTFLRTLMREIRIVYRKKTHTTHVDTHVYIHTHTQTHTHTHTHIHRYRLSVISTEWLPSGLHPILGIAYFSNVYRNIGIILPSESDRMTERKRKRKRVSEGMRMWRVEMPGRMRRWNACGNKVIYRRRREKERD